MDADTTLAQARPTSTTSAPVEGARRPAARRTNDLRVSPNALRAIEQTVLKQAEPLIDRLADARATLAATVDEVAGQHERLVNVESVANRLASRVEGHEAELGEHQAELKRHEQATVRLSVDQDTLTHRLATLEGTVGLAMDNTGAFRSATEFRLNRIEENQRRMTTLDEKASVLLDQLPSAIDESLAGTSCPLPGADLSEMAVEVMKKVAAQVVREEMGHRILSLDKRLDHLNDRIVTNNREAADAWRKTDDRLIGFIRNEAEAETRRAEAHGALLGELARAFSLIDELRATVTNLREAGAVAADSGWATVDTLVEENAILKRARKKADKVAAKRDKEIRRLRLEMKEVMDERDAALFQHGLVVERNDRLVEKNTGLEAQLVAAIQRANETSAENARHLERITWLEATLRPFALYEQTLHTDARTDNDVVIRSFLRSGNGMAMLTAGHFRRAARIYDEGIRERKEEGDAAR